MNLLYVNLRDYELYIYTIMKKKMNKQKKGPIVINMNIHPSLAIKIEDKKNLPVRDSNSHMLPSKLLSVAAQLTELRRKLDIMNKLYLY